MQSPLIQLLVLAGVAVFLILKLRGVLGTREGFEKPREPLAGPTPRRGAPNLEVIEGGPDRDITDHVPEDSGAAKALASMKRLEPSFGVGDFLQGARGAYEMILMAFERGDIAEIKPFLSEDVYQTFSDVVADRQEKGLQIEADFVGLREIGLRDAELDPKSSQAELVVRFVGELTSIVRDNAGDIVEGSKTDVKQQRDTWTFGRKMGADDPNWRLVATGE